MFKPGDIVERRVTSPRLKYIGVVQHITGTDTVIIDQVMYKQSFRTHEWELEKVDRDTYVDPKELTLLVPASEFCEQLRQDHRPSVTEAIEKGYHDGERMCFYCDRKPNAGTGLCDECGGSKDWPQTVTWDDGSQSHG